MDEEVSSFGFYLKLPRTHKLTCIAESVESYSRASAQGVLGRWGPWAWPALMGTDWSSGTGFGKCGCDE